jgi:hypothetical protein
MTQGPFPPPPGAPAPKAGPSALKAVGIGCGVMLLTGVCAATVAARYVGKALSGGDEIAAQDFSNNAPFAFEARSHGREMRVWLDVDARFEDGFIVTGNLAANADGAALRAVTLRGTLGDGCHNPALGESTSFCLGWRNASVNGRGTAAGRTRLFTIPARSDGSVVGITGALMVGAGTQLQRARIVVTE